MTTAVALYSGGLDSILSCRLVMSLGVRVKALRFVTPFFGHDLWLRKADYEAETREKYGIDVSLVEVTGEYIRMLADPPHGYGKNFNPCLDCKILLASKAREYMEANGFDFIISGEVVGQRPMSQRRDAMRIVERDSGCDDILLRPLCAKNLKPTRPEREGLIDREGLLAFSGRNRKPQMRLASEFGIEDYPSPAGGCVLTDPLISARIRECFQEEELPSADDLLLVQAGRQFRLQGGGRLAMGRNRGENARLEKVLFRSGDLILKMAGWPGPTAILRRPGGDGDLMEAAALVKRYAKKGDGREAAGVAVYTAPGGGVPKRVITVGLGG